MFFYDLETSGLNPRDDRVMQFAGQRTTMELEPIGEPINLLVTLADDTLPSPGALMVTGITPQKTVEEGYSEADFCRMFSEEIATPDTTIVGYNNIRFDDEFLRAVLWRNFRDPYRWSYADGRSRWDLLDVVRMTRALRPDGIEWPVVDGKATNRLELLTQANGIDHADAHDALSDVTALIDVARLIRGHQPQLYAYLYDLRDKKAVQALVGLDEPKPVVYSSGRYEQRFEKTTVVLPIANAPHSNVYVYDLRHDPSPWLEMNDEQLHAHIKIPYAERDDTYQSLPIKKLQYNRCPAVAPLGVLEHNDAWQRIGLDYETVSRHQQLVATHVERLAQIARLLDEANTLPGTANADAETRLYDGFIDGRDAVRRDAVAQATAEQLATMQPAFDDERLDELFVRYKARNFARTLSDSERREYETYRTARIQRQLPDFLQQLEKLSQRRDLTSQQRYVRDELELWAQAIMPEAVD